LADTGNHEGEGCWRKACVRAHITSMAQKGDERLMEDRRTTDDRRVEDRDTPDRRKTYLSIHAFAYEWGISRQTVYKWLECNLLEHDRKDGIIRIKNVNPEHHRPSSS
jgi:DNA-binding transcriptional regulator YiaG